MSELRHCDLCGQAGHPNEIKVRAVAWAAHVVAEGVKPFDTVERCSDFQACRARVEAKRERWPIRDSVTTTTLPPAPAEEVAL